MLKRVTYKILFAVIATLCSATANAQVPSIFILRAPAEAVDAILTRHGLTRVAVLRDGLESIVLVEGPEGADSNDLLERVNEDPAVVGLEPNHRVEVPEQRPRPALQQSTAAILEALGATTPVGYYGTTVPANYAAQPAGAIIRLNEAHTLASGAGIVAVIDTGVDPRHAALRGVLLPGYDFTRDVAGEASDFADLEQSTAAILEQSTAAILEQQRIFVVNQSTAAILEQSTAALLEGVALPPAFGHGTMVAGLIHLVAPTAAILPLKAFHADGTSELSNVIRAIYYAVDNGARVINMSFSVPESSQELMRAIGYANSRKVICIASAGNDGREAVVYPSGYRTVVGVASTNNHDVRSAFSNHGIASVSIAAPGETLVTTYPGNHWAAASGTSFSAALASGAVSLMLHVAPDLSTSQVADDLSKAKNIGQGLGEGRLDLYGAVARSRQR